MVLWGMSGQRSFVIIVLIVLAFVVFAGNMNLRTKDDSNSLTGLQTGGSGARTCDYNQEDNIDVSGECTISSGHTLPSDRELFECKQEATEECNKNLNEEEIISEELCDFWCEYYTTEDTVCKPILRDRKTPCEPDEFCTARFTWPDKSWAEYWSSIDVLRSLKIEHPGEPEVSVTCKSEGNYYSFCSCYEEKGSGQR